MLGRVLAAEAKSPAKGTVDNPPRKYRISGQAVPGEAGAADALLGGQGQENSGGAVSLHQRIRLFG